MILYWIRDDGTLDNHLLDDIEGSHYVTWCGLHYLLEKMEETLARFPGNASQVDEPYCRACLDHYLDWYSTLTPEQMRAYIP